MSESSFSFPEFPIVNPIVPPKDMGATIVYFIGYGTEFVKIGRSTRERLDWRLKSMQVSSPLRLEVVCFEDAELRDERYYHRLLTSYRHRGERFRAESEVLSVMRRIHEGMPAWDWFKCMELSGVFEGEGYDE